MADGRPKTALVHDFLLDVRGGERVFLALAELFPEADLFTAVYDEEGTQGRFAHRQVHTSYLQALRPTSRTFRSLLPLYPSAMERLDLSAYDLVISSSSAWAHGVRVAPGAVHVCYCHNPFRYAWDERDATLAARDPLTRAPLRVVLDRWRRWDRRAAQRVDRYVANSEATQERIARCFDRGSDLLYPPVQTERFRPTREGAGDYCVVVSELMAHKRIDVAVRAFSKLGRELVVVGDGPDERRLRSLAGPSVRFTGRVGDREVEALVAGSQALVVCGTEEFGIAAVEAQAAGRPVIAHRAGGVVETVLDGVTGTFFSPSEPDALAAAVARFDTDAVSPAACRANASRFSVGAFNAGMLGVVDEVFGGVRPRVTYAEAVR